MTWRRWLHLSRGAGPIAPEIDTQMTQQVEHLFPDDDAMMGRVRGRLMAQARAVPHQAVTPMRLTRRAPARRWLAPLGAVVATVVVGGGVAVANDGPGQAFYPVRLGLESWALPPVGTTARWAAELDRLRARMQEASSATGRHDTQAVDAALDAYDSELDALTAEALGSGSEEAQLQDQLAQDTGVLMQLAGALPGSANGAAQSALAHVSHAQQSLAAPGNGNGKGGGGNGGSPNGAGPGSSQGNGNGNGGTGGGNGNGNGSGNGGNSNGKGPTNSHKP